MNFEINLIFVIKSFNILISWEWKELLRWKKAIFLIFKRLSLKQIKLIFLEGESSIKKCFDCSLDITFIIVVLLLIIIILSNPLNVSLGTGLIKLYHFWLVWKLDWISFGVFLLCEHHCLHIFRILILLVFYIAMNRSSHQRCSVKKKVFFEISKNSQENTCTRASFLIKLWGLGLQLY